MATKFLLVTYVSIATFCHSAFGSTTYAPINPDNLDESGAHVCTATVEETYYYSESYVGTYITHTHTWCFAVPPRCRETVARYNIAYRTVPQVRSRKTLYCCDGYRSVPGQTYCKPNCDHDCYLSQGHGFCAFPGLCLCNEGFKGTSCESACAEGEYGKDCTKKCNCSEHGSCDPTTGACICHIGWTGQKCEHACVDSFGMHCVHPCACENNATCSNINGRCTCAKGFYGAYCHKECDSTSIAEDTCFQVCACQNGGTCDDHGVCDCPAGYKGEYCTEECDSRHYGKNCRQNCTCYNGDCDHVTGECTCYYGYGNQNCNEKCEDGYYGTLCETKCKCENGGKCYFASNGEIKCNCTNTGFDDGIKCTTRDCPRDEYLVNGVCMDCSCPWDTTESCHPLTGDCQCRTGFVGDQCETQCSMPFWGYNCEEVCLCPHGDCHFQTGECSNCYAGYIGTNCSEKCQNNTYGINCAQTCGCLNNAYCHETTGFCNCTAGYKGLLCDEPCGKDEWGRFCTNTCTCNLQTSICNPYNGECQCKPGFYGQDCGEKCQNWWYGFQCRHECQCDRSGTQVCDHATGECICAPGYKGVACSSQCADEFWGPNCQETCDCSGQGSCHQSTGECICYAGYRGDSCENSCGDGYYGYNCTETCPECTGVTYCNHVDGQCVSDQCQAGFTGKDCTIPCPKGTWGINCKNNCSDTCTTNGICSPVNGHCFCFPGYSGTNCEQACQNWKWGIECSSDCQCIKNNTDSCSVSRGKCSCKPGFHGEFCERRCEVGTWGFDCSYNCSDLCHARYSSGCDPEKGLPCICVDGYEPPLCNVPSTYTDFDAQTGSDTKLETPILVVIIIASLVAIAIIVLLVLYFQRRIRRLKEENMTVRYAANGVVHGETVVPNGRQIGMVNPTYAQENLNNERRYPHLSQRRALPDPERRCSAESFDSIETEKRQNTMSSRRPESSHYHELDDDRYTTLQSVNGAQPYPDHNNYTKNLHVDNYPNKVTDKYVFYTGANGQNERSRSRSGSRSPQRSYRDTCDQVNYGFDETDLKKNNLDLAAAFQTPQDTNTSPAYNNRVSTGYEKPVPTPLPKVPNNDNNSLTNQNSEVSPYTTPQQNSNDTSVPPSPVNGGYITPQNDINDSQAGNSATLPFSSEEDMVVDPETPAVENNNFANWLTFDNGRTDRSSSPFTSA